jgi:phage baseplate assembly protein W
MTLILKTPISKKASLYSDFRKDLKISPVSKDITVLRDEEAVKQSIKNLLLTDPRERLMQPFVGAGIKGLLFENLTPGVLKLIKEKVTSTISTYEPRAELIDVIVSSNYDDNQVNILIRFYVKNVEQPIELDVILERIR